MKTPRYIHKKHPGTFNKNTGVLLVKTPGCFCKKVGGVFPKCWGVFCINVPGCFHKFDYWNWLKGWGSAADFGGAAAADEREIAE